MMDTRERRPRQTAIANGALVISTSVWATMFPVTEALLEELLTPDHVAAGDPSREFVERHFAEPGADTALDRALRIDTRCMLVDDPLNRRSVLATLAMLFAAATLVAAFAAFDPASAPRTTKSVFRARHLGAQRLGPRLGLGPGHRAQRAGEHPRVANRRLHPRFQSNPISCIIVST